MTTTEVRMLREKAEDFLQNRMEAKVNDLNSDDPELEQKRSALLKKFQRENWIADAARRVQQLQVVTHTAKATHPDNQGTSLYAPPNSLPKHPLIGSHLLGDDFDTDVVGNAAALDVFKFLQLEHEGRSLLDCALAEEPELAQAFTDDSEKGMGWVRSFARIVEPRGDAGSDPRAKQVYWFVGDDPVNDVDFHLLSPLYSTILAHRVHRTINDDRFNDSSTTARKAYWANEYSEHEYRDYLGLAAVKFGGSKPQNISQLNSQRGGNNYLLASLPPQWKTQDVRPVLHCESAFTVFQRQPEVRRLIKRLRWFLRTDPKPNRETRSRRDADVSALIEQLVLFTHERHTIVSGWSGEAECRLADAEALWLDPGRGATDPEFAERRLKAEWVVEVRDRFAAWLNRQLDKALPVGDAEHAHWEALLKQETEMLGEVLSHV